MVDSCAVQPPSSSPAAIAAVLLASWVLATSTAVAREVDNYLAWGVDLEDSAAKIDHYMRQKLSEAAASDEIMARSGPLVDSPQDGDAVDWYGSCWATAQRMMRAAFYQPTYQKIEAYIDAGEAFDIYPRRPDSEDAQVRANAGQLPADGYMTDQEYIDLSIVGSSPMNTPFSRIINVNGIYTGADKFGHFTSWGVRYMKAFVDDVEKGASLEEAFYRVMDAGHGSEKSVVGMMFTKVFSRGDLEANYQGMRFVWSLCDQTSEVRLAPRDDRWELLNIDQFSIVPYVNPNWDESYHNSLFATETWIDQVIPTFANRHACTQLDSDWVRRQRRYYDSSVEDSTSVLYGDHWVPENFDGMVPEDHSLDAICASAKALWADPI